MGERDEKKSKKRHRSRSHDRKREKEKRRNRSTSRERDRGRKSRRDRSRSRSLSRERRDGKPDREPGKAAVEATEEEREAAKAAEQVQLEEEMRKRRERVKAWQEMKATQGHTANSSTNPDIGGSEKICDASNEGPQDLEPSGSSAQWSLEAEDDDEDEEDGKSKSLEIEDTVDNVVTMSDQMQEVLVPNKMINTNLPPLTTLKSFDSISSELSADDVDPLDAFMSSLYEESADVIIPQQPFSPIGIEPKSFIASDVGSSVEEDTTDIISTNNESKNSKESNPNTKDGKAIFFSRSLIGTSAVGGKKKSEKKEFNPYSSNFITFDQIAGGRELSRESSGGWESDTGGETDDDKEERERKEFFEALRKENGKPNNETNLEQKDDIASKQKSSKDIGRVFAGEGDMVDESEIEEKKKTALELLEEQKKGKELKPVDHSSIEYMPFRKNLYIVPRAVAKLSEEEVAKKREELSIKVRGKGCPCPVDTWEHCGLSDRILQVLSNLGFDAPFAIQKQAIPAIMAGRDVIAVAKTGSGKTLAFLVPMFRHILDQPRLREGEGPIGLVMAPARELAFQIFNEARKFTKALTISVACIYGGAGVAEQIGELKRGADIVVCTPGRMIDILCMQAGKMVSLKRVTMVVMDEADRMFDMGFEPQIKMIIQNIRPDRQTVLFSATFPKQIEKLAKSVLRLPLEILVGERSTVNKDIKQIVEVHDEDEKFMRLLQLLGVWYERGSILIFVDKQEKCDQLFQELMKSGYPSLSLHGGKDQLDRDHTLHEFKTLVKTVMVATSVAGRGLDVPEIISVVNYNCPNHLEDYVHRVGRTGRAGRKGIAYTFITPNEDQYAHIMVAALKKAGEQIPKELNEMAEGFEAKVKRGEAQFYSGSGFVGKGFTFDASEMNESQKLANMQRKAYEIEQGIYEADDAVDEDGAADEEGVASAPGVSSSSAPSVTSAAAMTPAEKAKALAVSLGLSTADQPTGGEGKSVDTKLALAKAKLIASQFEGKTSGPPGKEEVVQQHFADEIEINDYPAPVRRRVTNRSALDEVTDRTGVNIISKGTFVPPGKKVDAGERKLYLLIEGRSDMEVKQAKLEIQRMLEEETIRLGASATHSVGRYSVI